MRLTKKMLFLFLTVFLIFSSSAYAKSFEIEEIKLSNINISDEFGVCTLDSCDSMFLKMLKKFNHTYDDWVEKVMKPGNVYFYASDEDDRNIYIKCVDISKEQKKHDDEKYDIYMYDYNLASEEDYREEIMKEYKKSLTDSGVNDRGVEMKWMESTETIPTSYIVSSYKAGGMCVYEFHTIYAGMEWTYFMSSPTEFSIREIQILDNLVSGISYDYKVDYTHTKVVMRQNTQTEKASEQTIYIDSKDGRVVFFLTTITVVFMVIYLITDKQRNNFKNL